MLELDLVVAVELEQTILVSMVVMENPVYLEPTLRLVAVVVMEH
tara:strand:- start:484 stop:615 length:132 start_codon:yes stop_codon:yes gene_type:complete